MWAAAVGAAAQVTPFNVVTALLWAWLLGAVTGWLLPRPKWLSAGNHALLWLPWKNALLALHGALIVRECWHHFAEPHTFRRFLKAVALWVCGKGWTFDFPSSEASPLAPSADAQPASAQKEKDTWYVTEKDLAFFQYHGEGSGALPGAGPWEVLMEKEIPNAIKYTCWRRLLPTGKTEYKSVTYSPNATPEEFIDLYFDDETRVSWDTMIIHKEVVEHGDFSQRQQVVRWVRRFPFAFITDREYIIARRLFRLPNGDLVSCTKNVEHPRAPVRPDLVRMDAFYSMWRSRLVPCPWGSNKPATETVLLHHEQFKIPENLGRFAVRHGMWGFIKKLAAHVPDYVAARRERCNPFDADPNAYGSGFLPNPPVSDEEPPAASTGRLLGPLGVAVGASKPALAPGMRRCETSRSALSLSSLSTSGSAELGADGALAPAPSWRAHRRSTGGSSAAALGGTPAGPKRKLRRLAALAVAGGMALLVHRSNSVGMLNAPELSLGRDQRSSTRRRQVRQRAAFGSSPALSRAVEE